MMGYAIEPLDLAARKAESFPMKAELVRQIRKRLKLWRTQAMTRQHWNKDQFAAKAKVGASTIQGWLNEDNKNFNPRFEEMDCFLDACGKSFGDLFDFLVASPDDEARKLAKARNHPLIKHHYNALLQHIRELEDMNEL